MSGGTPRKKLKKRSRRGTKRGTMPVSSWWCDLTWWVDSLNEKRSAMSPVPTYEEIADALLEPPYLFRVDQTHLGRIFRGQAMSIPLAINLTRMFGLSFPIILPRSSRESDELFGRQNAIAPVEPPKPPPAGRLHSDKEDDEEDADSSTDEDEEVDE